jgi:hypothetical protein
VRRRGYLEVCEIVSHITNRTASENVSTYRRQKGTQHGHSPPHLYHYLPTATTGI